jgi:hypothetical protein
VTTAQSNKAHRCIVRPLLDELSQMRRRFWLPFRLLLLTESLPTRKQPRVTNFGARMVRVVGEWQTADEGR